MATGRWTKEQIKLAFYLYCQLPYGRIHARNPEIIGLAKLLGRTPDAVAMKMLNLASIDPAITGTGRSGLGNASALDRSVWDEFHANWEQLAVECQLLQEDLETNLAPKLVVEDRNFPMEDFTGETRPVMMRQRIKQNFFRRMVLSSYRGRCCMSGVSEPRLLIASHIVPWSSDEANRLNPSNGLCLSAIHDRAFDQGLIGLSDNLTVIVSDDLKRRKDVFVKEVLLPLQGQRIETPERFAPRPEFLAWHRNSVFLDSLQ
jgi:putative restriction endonuclease